MYTILMLGTTQSVLIRGVSFVQGCPYFSGVLIRVFYTIYITNIEKHMHFVETHTCLCYVQQTVFSRLDL